MPSNESNRQDDDDKTKAATWEQKTHATPVTPQSPSFFDNTGHDESFELAASVSVFNADNLPVEFGHYTLLEKIGEGGAGVVFKAKPPADRGFSKSHDVVAVKLIRPEIMASPKASQRFEKEARLHAEVASPFVTQHLEFGCEHGMHFIASEFVEGVGLDEVIGKLQSLPAKHSLLVVADLLKALSALHSVGVIHRDVKPGNVIVSFRGGKKAVSDISFADYEIGKLTDFGLARHIEQSASLAMTRQQTLLGTPLYMAPEQYLESRSVDARADIYSTGITLYQMLAGEAPFTADEPIELAEMHRVERPRPLTLLRPDTSEALNRVVMKSLEKDPALRYQNASEMLSDIEKILDDQPTSLRLYPETPDSSHPSVRSYDFEWTLDATTRQLWPLVSDTDRFNEAIGLPAPKFTYDHTEPERKIFAQANFNGMKVQWREHPFQWILEREMSVLREFESGPFEWVTSTVELHPLTGNRTRLIHSFQVKPRGLFGKLMTPIQFRFLTKRSLNRVYSNLERIANDSSCGYACDVSFSKPFKLSKKQRQVLTARVEKLAGTISSRPLAKEFGQLISLVADPMAARIRPIPLSQKLNCTLEQSLQICLHGVEVGLLNMSWDVICPVCKIASGNATSIKRVRDHGHCEVCNLDFEVNFSKSVEVVFSAHPEIRLIEAKTYCIGGPYHAPHVLAQNRLSANQFVDIGTILAPGKYEIRGPQLPQLPKLRVHDDALATRAELAIGVHSPPQLPDLRTGVSCVHIDNQSEKDLLVRLEQASDLGDAITAASASQHTLFQKLFPNEVVNSEELVDLSNVYLLAIRHQNADALVERVGDLQVRKYWSQIQQELGVKEGDCDVVESSYDSILISCGILENLVDALDSFTSSLAPNGIPAKECSFAINSGEIMIGAQGNQPSAFGKTVRKTKQLLNDTNGCSLVMPEEIYDAIANIETESAESLLSKFAIPNETKLGDPVYLAWK